MTKISIYQIDEYVTADDKWIGTDVNTYNKTKNFTPRKLSNYFNGSQVINTGVDLLYKYFTITPPETRPTGTISFEEEIGPTVQFSNISTFLLSKTTLKGNDVSEFLDFLVGSSVLMYKAKNINLFGNYKILSVDTYITDPEFFVVNVEFIEGNGSIEEDEDYMISVVDFEKTIPIPQLVKETFDYESSNIFTLSNVINNVLQVIVNTTSLHPEGYSYTLPSTITILNELHVGDVITVVYNYLEEFFEVPSLQRVTNVGNHTTNDIVVDGVLGDYTNVNTITSEGLSISSTSVGDYQYQATYSVEEISISEIDDSENIRVCDLTPVSLGTYLTYSGGYNYANISSGSPGNGPSLTLNKVSGRGIIKVDNITLAKTISLQFPDKTSGTYTIATTSDIPEFVNHWTKTGDIIRNNNIGNIEFFSSSNYIAPNGDAYLRNISGAVVSATGGVILPNNGRVSCDGDGTNYIQGVRDSHWISDIKFKYATDLSSTYDDRTLVDKGYVTNRLVSEKSTDYTLQNSDSGGTIIFTASATLTVPTGLASGFECKFITLAGATLTVVSTGNTINNASGSTLAPQSDFFIKRMIASNTFIVTGDL